MFKQATSFRSRIVAGATLLAAMAVLAGNAWATVIYNGASFGLSLDSQSGNTYTFTYSADFTNWLGSSTQQYIAAVNFKPNTGMVPTAYSLLSTDAPGSWSVGLGNANNNGCQTGSADSFVCALANPLTAASTSTGAIYNWVFQISYASPLNSSSFTDAPIRAWFVDGTGKGTGLMSLSTDITTNNVPEPGSLALLGIGLLALGLFGRRKRGRGEVA